MIQTSVAGGLGRSRGIRSCHCHHLIRHHVTVGASRSPTETPYSPRPLSGSVLLSHQPNSSSLAAVVVTPSLSAVAEFPVALTCCSSVPTPAYSDIRMSGYAAATLNFTEFSIPSRLSSLDPTALLLGSFKEAGSIARVQSKRKG